MRLDELPGWLQVEFATQAPVGQRNNHCIKIAPQAMRFGMQPEEVLAALQDLYPSARPGELELVIDNATDYAKEDSFVHDPEYASKKKLQNDRRALAEKEMPLILRDYQMEDFDSTLCELPPIAQRRLFIKSLFKPDDVLWIGDKYSSGPQFAGCFQPAHVWLAQTFIAGEFISHSTFRPGTFSRAKENIAERRYLVLESDALHPSDLAAVARYCRDHHEMILRAIVTTGGVRHAPSPGLHFWFDCPEDIDEWAAVLQGYGADIATLRGPQPVRLPGITRSNTGQPQQLLWLDQ